MNHGDLFGYRVPLLQERRPSNGITAPPTAQRAAPITRRRDVRRTSRALAASAPPIEMRAGVTPLGSPAPTPVLSL